MDHGFLLSSACVLLLDESLEVTTVMSKDCIFMNLDLLRLK